MAITFIEQHFSSETEAQQEIEHAGLWAVKKSPAAETNQSHWHAFDAQVYILDGVLNLTDSASGNVYACTKGCKIIVPEGTLHSESHEGYTALFGTSVDPTQLSGPIQLPPEQLAEI